MTAAIQEENAHKNVAYQFVEEDDELEEFDIEFDEQIEIEMTAGGNGDQLLWQHNWDDEVTDENFKNYLRAQ